MPISPALPDLYPANLFEDGASCACEDRLWWVLHTRPRQEKCLSKQLHAARIPFYLPLVARPLSVRNKVMTSYLPLFPGYVFVLANWDERVAALATARVVQSLAVAEQRGLWRDLGQIERLIRSGAPILPEDRLAPGMWVEIKSGPLAGLKGKIVHAASRRRFVVEVDFIQRGASVTLDDCTLVQLES